MKYTVQQFSDRFRTQVGDSMKQIPDDFIMRGLNWAFNSIPSVPKLSKAFAKHYTVTLLPKMGNTWNLNGDFRRLAEIPVINFYTTTGGNPCKACICYKDNKPFFDKNGLPEARDAGMPCEYTIEQEADDILLVFDRPTNIPLILDYIAHGYPQPVTSLNDEIELSAVIENLIIATLEHVYYEEAADFGFSGAVMDILDNKYLPEAIQMLNKRWSGTGNYILGEQ